MHTDLSLLDILPTVHLQMLQAFGGKQQKGDKHPPHTSVLGSLSTYHLKHSFQKVLNTAENPLYNDERAKKNDVTTELLHGNI